MASVLLIDNHLLSRLGLRQMLGEEIRGLVFGEAKSGTEAIQRLIERTWTIVIMALSLGDRDDLPLLKEIRSLRPSTRVLVLSVHSEPRYALQAQQLGATGYVCKCASRAELLRACKAVLRGDSFFENIPPGESEPLHTELSSREYEVLLAFAAGKRSGEIAADLSLSAKTIGTYKHRILAKLGLHSTADLVRYVITHRLS